MGIEYCSIYELQARDNVPVKYQTKELWPLRYILLLTESFVKETFKFAG